MQQKTQRCSDPLDADAYRSDLTRPRRGERQPVPLGATPVRTEDGWSIAVPVHGEYLTVQKQVVVAEEVRVRWRAGPDKIRLEETVERERLRVEGEGAIEVRDAPPMESPHT